MKPIELFDKENKIKIIIQKYKELESRVNGLRIDKVFIDDGLYKVNLKDKTIEIQEFKCKDEEGYEVSIEYVNWDTSTRVDILIVVEDHLILMRSPDNFYYLPGGHRKIKETYEEAVTREVTEELGIRVEKIEKLKEFQSEGFGPEVLFRLYYDGSLDDIEDMNPEDLVPVVNVHKNKINKIKIYPEFISEYL